MEFLQKLSVLILLVFASSCHSSDNRESKIDENEGQVQRPYPFVSSHFNIYYLSMDTANLQAIADTLEFHYPRIITDLDCGVLPTVNVHFYSDHAALASAVASVVPNLPSWASGLAISETQIHMMSPNLQNGANYPWIMSILTHEFAHCASLHVNSSIANRPRWLWESVAIYESRQFVDPSAIAYLVEGDPPSLSELNSFNNTKVYDVGYLIAEYIVTEFGYPTLKMLIQNNGDIGTTLGKNADQFQQDWFQFVKTKYGI